MSSRILDVVLLDNPNPLGMAVRVFRHLCLKDAKKITRSAVKYLSICANKYSVEELKCAELHSYRNSLIEPVIHKFFMYIDPTSGKDLEHQFSIVRSIIMDELDIENPDIEPVRSNQNYIIEGTERLIAS